MFISVSVEEKKEKTLANIISAKNKIRQEINIYKERLKLAKETIAKFKAEIIKQQMGSGSNSSGSVHIT